VESRIAELEIPAQRSGLSGFAHIVPLDRLSRPKVAIMGFTDHRVQALALPLDQFEIWGLNELHRYHPNDLGKFSRWFEIHDRATLAPDPEHLKTLASLQVPVYMHQHWADIPPSLPFPREIVQNVLSSEYFTSSVAWEIALAIVMGAEEIHVYGVDMASDTEWGEQKACCEFWLGIAQGRGIRTYVPPTSDLLKAVGQYGFGDTGSQFSQKLTERIAWLHRNDNEMLAAIRNMDAEYETKREQLDEDYKNKRGQLMEQRNQIVGGIQDCNYWLRSWAIKSAAPNPNGPSPDRSQDPRTGIQAPAADSKETSNRIAPELARMES